MQQNKIVTLKSSISRDVQKLIYTTDNSVNLQKLQILWVYGGREREREFTWRYSGLTKLQKSVRSIIMSFAVISRYIIMVTWLDQDYDGMCIEVSESGAVNVLSHARCHARGPHKIPWSRAGDARCTCQIRNIRVKRGLDGTWQGPLRKQAQFLRNVHLAIASRLAPNGNAAAIE